LKTVKVTAKGQVTLPQPLRDQLEIDEGTYLEASIFQNGILLKPLKGGHQLIKEYSQKYGNNDEQVLEEARTVLKRIPFSISQRSTDLREE